MSYFAPSTSSLQSTKRINQGAIRGEPQRQSPHTVSIHILDDDSLLNVFYFYRSILFSEDDDTSSHATPLLRVAGGWALGRWWHKPANVCQRWRSIILGSAFYLDISLVCTKGTPVAGMLAHSPELPPLPLVIDYSLKYDDITAEDEERAILVLRQRDRVRRIRLQMPSRHLQKLIATVEGEYPILEYLIMYSEFPYSILMFPETFQAPHLRHLALCGVNPSIGSRLLTSAVGLVTLVIIVTHPDAYFYPNSLHHWLSFVPRLESLMIHFLISISDDDLERQIAHSPIMTPVALPNFRHFRFQGPDTYLKAFVHQIITPRLEVLEINFMPYRPTFTQAFSAPRLQHLINTAVNFRFDSAKFKIFTGRVAVKAYPRGEAEMPALSINAVCSHLDWPIFFAARLSNSLSQMFSAVEHLALEYEAANPPFEELIKVDHTGWRGLFRSFRNVRTLRIDHGLVKSLSLCLQPKDGESPSELLPELQELTYSGSDEFTSFIDFRQNAGRPVTLVCRSPT